MGSYITGKPAWNALPIGTVRLGHYITIRTENGWEEEHRLIIGLEPGDPRIVHHVNGDKHDNRPENLEIMERDEHTTHHMQGRVLSYKTRSRQRAYALTPEGTEAKSRAGRAGGGSNRNSVTVAEVVSLREHGLTLKQIGRKLGIGVKVVRNRLKGV